MTIEERVAELEQQNAKLITIINDIIQRVGTNSKDLSLVVQSVDKHTEFLKVLFERTSQR